MIINHNIASLNTYRQLSMNNAAGSKSLEKLSSGYRINRAGDDAAGLAISEKMRGQIRGLDQASRNAQDAISLIQTAEGALNETHSILQRMRELAVQSATDTNTADDRTKIQAEMDQLAAEITRISNTTEFNTRNLLAGGLNTTFHIGANENQNMSLSIGGMDAFSLGVATTAVSASLTTTNAAKLTGVSNAGSGLTGASTYSILVTKNAAGVSSVTASKPSGGTGSISGTYTGVDNASYVIRAAEVDAGVATGIQVSTDGGITYGGTIALSSGSADIGNGLTFALTAGTNAVGDTWSFSATASTATLQLADSAGTATIGAAVTVKNNATSATIGDASVDATVDVTFNFATLTTSATNGTQISVASVGSKAAVTDAAGNVTQEAKAAAGISVTTQAKANKAITVIDNAIRTVSTTRSKLGAHQNRLEHTIANLGTSSENLTAAESRIRDVDMAKEMMEFTKNNILQQAAQAMLAQANQLPQGVLQLLR